MALFRAASTALARTLSPPKTFNYSNYARVRCLITASQNPALNSCVVSPRSSVLLPSSDYPTAISNWPIIQKRGFFGFGGGLVGNTQSKVYEETQVVGYSPEQLFDVVAAVNQYQEFLPWCQRSEVVRRYPDGRFDADLEIGFKCFVESYVSHVELSRPNSIKTTSSQSNLFHHLINVWKFNPGPVPGTCSLHFLVDFKFRSPLYGQIANGLFQEVVSRLMASFTERCRILYGPAVRVYQNSYEQRPGKNL